MNKLFFFSFLLFSSGLLAQAPANDDCAGAISLGTLGDPTPCSTTGATSGTLAGASYSINSTTSGATPENPYVYQGPCAGSNMAVPANDIWYSFILPPDGAQVTIAITGAAFTPNVALWEGTCNGLIGRGCTVGTPGSASMNVAGLSPGVTYYIQLSGNTGESGAFTMNVNAFQDCANCNIGSDLTVTPLPVDGMYNPGQTVNFCFKITDWSQIDANWLHGVSMVFGSGWNLATLTTTPPASCDGNGTWAYYPGGETSCATGAAWPAGFYYTSTEGTSTCTAGPGNTYGDNCSTADGNITATTWNFCFSIQAGNICNPGANLSVAIKTSADGQSGSWSDNACDNDPTTNFTALMACCPPTMSATAAGCGATGSATSNVVVGAAGLQDPYVFVWTGPSGPVATNTVTGSGTNTINNVPAGTYTVVVTDKNLCAQTATVIVTGTSTISSTVTPTNISCGVAGSINTTAATGGTAPYAYSWTGPGAYTSAVQSPAGLTVAGIYSLTVTDANNCTFMITATVVSTNTLTITVNSPTVCAEGSVALIAGGAITYSWTPTTGLSSTTGSIVVATPTAATIYSVTGTGGSGCTATTTATVTTINNPTVSVVNTDVCSGTTGTLTASGAISYTWSTGVISPTVTANPTTTTNYTVTGSSGMCTAIAVGTITVTPLPTITVNPGTICSGNTTTLTAGGATTYSWVPNTGLSSTTSSVVIANPPTTTAYTVIGAVGTCTSSATTTVSVVTAIVPTVTSNTPCANQTLTLTCNPGTYVNYVWTGPNAYTATVQNPIRAGVSAADVGTYTILVTDVNNCINTATISVIVNPLPVVTANASPACLGQTINLSATSGFVSYSWNGPGGYTSPLQNPSIPNVTEATAGQYEVTVTNNNTCTNGNIVNVTVYQLPVVTITSPSSLCISSTGTLTASGALDYIWTPVTDLNTNFGNQVLLIPTSVTNHDYTVTGQDANGCINTAITSIAVNGLPTVSIAPDTTKGCTPQCATYTATNNPAASNYSWSFGNGQSSSYSVSPSATMCYTTTGNYSVILTLTDINGCVNTATASVMAYPIPNPEFVYNPNPATILSPQIQFINQSSGAIITSYNWNFGDASGTSSTLYNPSYTYADTGTYYVTLIDTSINGCWASIVQPVIIEQDFTLYVPNAFTPNGDGKNEVFKAQGDGILSFTMYIFDRWGNPIFTSNDINTGWNGRRNNSSGTEALQEDVYVWKIDLSSVVDKQSRSYTGIVTLLK